MVSGKIATSPDAARQAVERISFITGVALIACVLQGCGSVDFRSDWASQRNYLTQYHFIPAGQPVNLAVLNSCELPGLPAKLQCNGNGMCKEWNVTAKPEAAIRFCQCFEDWADPECRTPRKSQRTAYFLSLFLGFTGADRLYLGDPMAAMWKFSSIGGLGAWWLFDIFRVGSGPIYASDGFRLATDLDHMLFVLSSVAFFAALGYFGSTFAAYHMKVERKKRMLLKAEDEFFHNGSAAVTIDADDQVGQPSKAQWGTPTFVGPGYGSTSANTDPAPSAASSEGDRRQSGPSPSAAPLSDLYEEMDVSLKGYLTREDFVKSFNALSQGAPGHPKFASPYEGPNRGGELAEVSDSTRDVFSTFDENREVPDARD